MGPPWSQTPTPRPARRARTSVPTSLPARAPAAKAAPALSVALAESSDRDIRSKRPPALSFLLRMSTLRRGARVLSLLALDFAGVAIAIFTALLLKEAVH